MRKKDEIRIQDLETSTKQLFRRTKVLAFLHLMNGSLSICTFFGYPIPMLLISGFTQIGFGIYFLVKK